MGLQLNRMNKTYPFYIKLTIGLLLLILVSFIFIRASGMLIPLFATTLFSILFYPIAEWMEKFGISRLGSSLISILLVFLFFSGLIYVLSHEIIGLSEDIPKLQSQAGNKITAIQTFIRGETHMSSARQIAWVKEKFYDSIATGGFLIQNVLYSFTSTFVLIIFIPIYMFFLLYNRDKFKIFILKITEEGTHTKVDNIITQIQKMIQSYLSGVFIVMLIVATFNTAGLLILGVEYAVFFGILSAILNIIPYIGIFSACTITAIVTFITKDSIWYTVGVIGVFLFMHLIESNILTPRIVGSKVSVNAFAAIIALLFGSMLWGIAGMILFIPMAGMIKIICDNIDSLKPYGYLIGTEFPKKTDVKKAVKKAEANDERV